jgi:formylglycine-generating enzyme required for sulfatase activity
VVPAGSFTMGSTLSEALGGNESPPHLVTFAQPFAVGKFAVTFDEWDACAADGGCNGYRPADEDWGRGRRPVINVSWGDAKAYLAWISRKTGKTYRLLSEAEREYVTRAGTTTPYWWGTSISTDQANYNGTYPNGKGPGQFRRQTVPVDSFAPNPFGLYQVHGNVWEWVQDCDHAGYDGAPTDGSAWTSGNGSAWTGGACIRRVLRGGSGPIPRSSCAPPPDGARAPPIATKAVRAFGVFASPERSARRPARSPRHERWWSLRFHRSARARSSRWTASRNATPAPRWS